MPRFSIASIALYTRFRNARSSAASSGTGRTVELDDNDFVKRGRGYIQRIADLEQIVVKSNQGVPVLLRDVAHVELAPDFVGAQSPPNPV